MKASRRAFMAGALTVGATIGRAIHAANPSRARACIFLNMAGGPSQIDTWDPKPGTETGGPFAAIATRTDGLQVSQHLPRLAARSHRYAVLRSLVGTEPSHDRAAHLAYTSYPPDGGRDHPALGSLVAHAQPPQGLPGYVAIGGEGGPAGLLGASFAPFRIGDPRAPVQNLGDTAMPTPTRFERRVAWIRALDRGLVQRNGGAPELTERISAGDAAVAMNERDAGALFDLDGLPAHRRAPFGASRFGVGCSMAARLVELGVPFVEVVLPGWDTHRDNFAQVERLSAELDLGFSALLDDLVLQGLFERTVILWCGEFGRTPTINGEGGRDHYPNVCSAVLAGGGIRGGTVFGATDATGREIREGAVSFPDLLRTVAVAIALDPDALLGQGQQRPRTAIDEGRPIREVLSG